MDEPENHGFKLQHKFILSQNEKTLAYLEYDQAKIEPSVETDITDSLLALMGTTNNLEYVDRFFENGAYGRIFLFRSLNKEPFA